MKAEILNILRQSDQFVSGGDLSRRLGVTRAAIWKVIKSLQQEGYLIEAVTNRGYRLAGPPDILSDHEISAALAAFGAADFVREIQCAESTDSTNLMARRAAEAGAPGNSLFLAEQQLAGRGRRGRNWHSGYRQGLWFSILLRPQATPAELAPITLLAGLCVAEAIRDFCGIDVGLKWPNDVLATVNGRKLCGILTEMILEENSINAVIIGIGINIGMREFPEGLSASATSMQLESGRPFRRADVLAAVMAAFARRYGRFLTDKDWLDDYQRLCLTLNRAVRVTGANGAVMLGKAVGLDAEGELIVETGDGNRQIVRAGEVSVRGLLND